MISDVTPEVDKIEYLKNALIAKLTENRQGINRMDFQDKGAKEIKRYFQYNFPEGYVYCIILNNDNEATFKETLIFDTFDHIKLQGNHTGTSYTLSVGPLQKEIVLMKAKRNAKFNIL